MKKMTNIFMISFLAVIISCGCTSNDKPLIGILFHKLTNTGWEEDNHYLSEAIQLLGGEVVVRNANKSESIQYDQAIELIEQGVDVLIIVAQNVNSAAAIVRKAEDNGVKVIAYRRMIENANLNYFTGFDLSKCGEFQIEYVLSKFQDTANIVLLEGDYFDKNAHLIEKAHLKGLKKRLEDGSINVVYKDFIENWSEDKAAFEFRRVYNLSDKRIDAVVAANDKIAKGVINEIDKIGLEKKIPVTGMDAKAEAIKRVINGKQGMTIYKPVKELAEKTAELAVKLAKNENINFQFVEIDNHSKNIQSIVMLPKYIDKSNVEMSMANLYK